jgi:hypothetical protein
LLFKNPRKTGNNALYFILALCSFLSLHAFGGLPVGQFVKDMTGLDIGTLDVGGCARINYVYSKDYPAGGRSKSAGDIEWDTYRINVDWQKDSWSSSVEYRWYDDYNFMHHVWVGYQLDEFSTVKVGLNRVPFGVGAYGPANSWFFDQHYYVGLADDMDVGIKYTRKKDNLALDFAYYAGPEPNGNGATADSARYSYDIVDTGNPNAHYRERNQFNARAIVSTLEDSIPTDVGVSLQVGQLVAGDNTGADDTIGYAASVHSSSTKGPWNLKLQLTHYDYRPDYNDPAQSDDLIAMGAYDYAFPVASQGTIPSAALSYTIKPEWDLIDSITFYNDYSVILKDGEDAAGNELNSSTMNVTGAAIASGGWYINIDFAMANGNYFVGPNGDFGANSNNQWQDRFNINVGYYF